MELRPRTVGSEVEPGNQKCSVPIVYLAMVGRDGGELDLRKTGFDVFETTRQRW